MDVKKYLISRLATTLEVELKENPDLRDQGKNGWASRHVVEVADLNNMSTLAHEFTHVIQKLTGEYILSIPDFRKWMGDDPIDEDFVNWFLPIWKTWVEAGFYERRDLVWEFLPYYVTYASNGWQVFQKVCRESGALNPPPGGYEQGVIYPPLNR